MILRNLSWFILDGSHDFIFFFAPPTACGSCWARDRTAKAATQATAVTMPDPYPTAPQRKSSHAFKY